MHGTRNTENQKGNPKAFDRAPCAVDRKLILLDFTGGFANFIDNFASGIVFEFSGHVPGSLTGGISGHSSVGRAQASQAWGRGFEPRCPLQVILQAWPNSLFEVAPSAGGNGLRIADALLVLFHAFCGVTEQATNQFTNRKRAPWPASF